MKQQSPNPARLVLALLLAVSVTSCALFRSPGIAIPDTYRKASEDERRRIGRLLDASRASCRALRAQAETRISKGIGSETFLQVIAFERPAPMRLDFFDPSGTALLALAVITEHSFSFLEQAEKRVIVGRPSAAVFGSTLGVPLEVSEVTALFCGTIPEAYAIEDAYRNEHDGGLILDVRSQVGRTIRLRADALSLEDGGILALDELAVRNRFGDLTLRMRYVYAEPEAFPERITIDVIETGTTLDMQFRRAERNPSFSERAKRAFSLHVPRGYTVMELAE